MMNVKQDTNWVQNRFDLLSSSIFYKNTLNTSITVDKGIEICTKESIKYVKSTYSRGIRF